MRFLHCTQEHDRISTALVSMSVILKEHGSFHQSARALETLVLTWPREQKTYFPSRVLCRKNRVHQNSSQDCDLTLKPRPFGKGMIFATIRCMAMTLAKWSVKNRFSRTWLVGIKFSSFNDQARVAACKSSRTGSTMLAAASCSGSWEASSQA